MKSLIFHIEHGSWSSVLELPSENTLSDLAHTIIDAAGFDMDHCYGFYEDLGRGHQDAEHYTLFADIGEEVAPVDKGVETTSLDAAFEAEKQMIFLFDYGDDWRFLVTCTKEESGRAFKRPRILATAGTAPIQYPDYQQT